MRTVLAAFVACLALPGPLYAQTAKNCTVYIEVDDTEITSGTLETNRCNYNSKVKFLVSNLSDNKLKVTIDNFQAKGNDCANAPSGGALDLPISDAKRRSISLTIPGNEEKREKHKIKDGTSATECFKFDITLWDKDGEFITRLDPDLEVTEPMGPPPAAGVKPKGGQR